MGSRHGVFPVENFFFENFFFRFLGLKWPEKLNALDESCVSVRFVGEKLKN